jgi:hypothetical protein
MATKDEIRAAALAIMKAEGWVVQSGVDIMEEENPRSRRWVSIARLALSAAASVKRKAPLQTPKRGTAGRANSHQDTTP